MKGTQSTIFQGKKNFPFYWRCALLQENLQNRNNIMPWHHKSCFTVPRVQLWVCLWHLSPTYWTHKAIEEICALLGEQWGRGAFAQQLQGFGKHTCCSLSTMLFPSLLLSAAPSPQVSRWEVVIMCPDEDTRPLAKALVTLLAASSFEISNVVDCAQGFWFTVYYWKYTIL